LNVLSNNAYEILRDYIFYVVYGDYYWHYAEARLLIVIGVTRYQVT